MLTFHRRPFAGGAEVLSRRVRRHLDRHSSLEDEVLTCMRGRSNHSLVLFADRLVIVKPSLVGARVTTLYLSGVCGIHVRVGLLNCNLEVTTPVYARSRRDKRERGHRSSNCVPFGRRRLNTYAPVFASLRAGIAAANLPTNVTAGQSPEKILSELERLGALRLAGVLSHHEFERAKRLLLESSEAA